jgi:vacuolar-type H+-ATPase subunit I/STV1
MYGGYALLRLLTQANAVTPFRLAWFRAGRAHAGVLLLMSLLYYAYLDKTSLSPAAKHAACATLIVGILAQSGGFFLHMMKGQPDRASIGFRPSRQRSGIIYLQRVLSDSPDS